MWHFFRVFGDKNGKQLFLLKYILQLYLIKKLRFTNEWIDYWRILNHLCTVVNPDWHELWKQEKCSSLATPRGIFYSAQWAWRGCQINKIGFNFHLQKSLEIFDECSADKIWSKDKEIKVSPLMPIRVKGQLWKKWITFVHLHSL